MTASRPEGFLAVPEGGTGPGVLVLHAWWGLNDTMKTLCTRLAEAGFTAFAPDLYHGRIATTIPDAEKLCRALDADQARADVAAAAAFLAERADRGQGLAVMGFSLGAWFAMELSVKDPERIRSVVIFYGSRPGDYTGSRAAYLLHLAETDSYEPQEDIAGTEAALRSAGRPHTIHVYPDTLHWFFEPDRNDAYDAAAAALAWERTLAFLKSSAAREDHASLRVVSPRRHAHQCEPGRASALLRGGRFHRCENGAVERQRGFRGTFEFRDGNRAADRGRDGAGSRPDISHDREDVERSRGPDRLRSVSRSGCAARLQESHHIHG